MVRDIFPSATIIRPADTFGHEDRFFNYYAGFRAFPFSMVPLLDAGTKTHKMPVYVSGWGIGSFCHSTSFPPPFLSLSQVADIAQGVVNMIADPATAGKTYEFTG